MDRRELKRIADSVYAGRFEEALSVSLDSTVYEINRAQIRLLHKHRDCPRARELINRAKNVIANESALEKGRRLSRLGYREQALACLLGAREQERSPDDLVLIGRTLLRLDRTQQALDHLEEAVRRRGSADDLLWLGSALERLGERRRALEAYQRALRGRGGADDHYRVGGVLFDLGRVDEAAGHLERSLQLGFSVAAHEILARCRRRRYTRALGRLTGVPGAMIAALRKRPALWLAVCAAAALVYGISRVIV